MKYPGEDWIALDKYTREEGRLSVVEIRLIIREVLKALLSLKSFGVVHGDITARNILYNERTSDVKLMNFGYSGVFENGTKAAQHQDHLMKNLLFGVPKELI
ncbi:hypothetical protein BASA62_006266 [Batrachochytrium salamandrivorans]|nr:hypothetical protein BASA62_006266 [Batrachochytrium salamandrivorans]